MPSRRESGCPSEETIVALALQRISDSYGCSLEAHLSQCPACRERLHQERLLHWVGIDAEPDPLRSSYGHGDPAAEDEGNTGIGPAGRANFAGYRIVEEIHRGGQGIVFKAIQDRTGQKVALKVLRDGSLASGSARHHFQREVQSLKRLQHPNIARILDVTESDELLWYAMEYISGERIDDFVQNHKLDIREKVALFSKVCAGVAHAHQRGIIHCDLKPGNILVDAQGEPHILDFGLARGAPAPEGKPIAHLTMTGQLLGTLAYMAPEQAAGRAREIDVRTDVYALGVILYQMLTTRHPYSVDGPVFHVLRTIQEAQPILPTRIARHLDRDLQAVVLKALEKPPAQRYQSAHGLHDDLRRYLARMPVLARSWSTAYLFRKIASRNRAASALLGLIALGVLALTGLMAHSLLTAPREPVRDDFEDGVMNPRYWVIGGTERAFGWPDQGVYRFIHREIRADDGYLEMRIQGPTIADTDGLTYGAEAWARTAYNYNDGFDHLINFTWSAEVNAKHVDGFAIQIMDGVIPAGYDFTWWREYRDGYVNLYQTISSAEANDVGQVTTKPQTWSIVINAERRIATLYRGADGKGELLQEAWLDPTKSWHVCFFHMDVTSRGFSNTDNALKLYSFSSTTVPEDGQPQGLRKGAGNSH